MDDVQNFDIVVSEFDLQSGYYVPFRTNTLKKDIYLSNLLPDKIWHKVILMWGAMHESRLMRSRHKNSWSSWHSSTGAPQALSMYCPGVWPPRVKWSISPSSARGREVINSFYPPQLFIITIGVAGQNEVETPVIIFPL